MKSGKGSKISPAKEEEIPFDFTNPLMLIKVLSETNFGRILQALKGLKPFVRQNQLKELLDNELLEKIQFLIQDKKSTNEVIEFSLELLSELLNFKPVLSIITEEEEEFIVQLYTFLKTKPLDVQVQCVKCLSRLTTVTNICQLISEKSDMNLLFTRMTQKDPDVQANVLKIIHNLVKADIEIAEKVINLPGFNYTPLFQLLNSDYPIVQHRSLNLIIHYTSYDHITTLRQIFVEQNGINVLVKMLEAHKWPDLHEKVFTILNNISHIPETFTKLGENGIKMLIRYVDEIESQKLQFTSYDTILKMGKNSPSGLKSFVDYGLFDLVMAHLKDNIDGLMFRLSISGVAVLSENHLAMNLMAQDPDLILTMFDVLKCKYKQFDWSVRYQAAVAIHLMMTKNGIFYEKLMENRKWQIILDLLSYTLDGKISDIPYEMTLLLATILKVMILEVYKCVSCPSKLCSKLIHVLKHLMMDPKSDMVELKCVATEMVEMLVEYTEFRDALKEKTVYRSLSKLMFRTNENLTILEAYLKLFITLIEWDSTFIDELTYVHAIDWFIEKREIHRNLPIARRFLDFIFDKCKYVKIHFTNRLDLWDKIESGFYITRACSSSHSYFKSLKTFIREKYLKARPVYYIDFGDSEAVDLLRKRMTELSTYSIFDDTISTFSVETTIDDECIVLELETLRDPFLKIKLEELKILLGYTPHQKVVLNLSEALNREEYLSKVKILADFVCGIMSSIDEADEDCRNHSFELHLSEIKQDLNSSIIPLGYLKLGTKLEKALLFKTFGDQVGIPSAFVRAHCGTGWNEIYLTPATAFKEESLQLVAPTKDKTSVTKRITIVARKSERITRSQSIPKKSISKMDRRSSRRSFRSRSQSEPEEPLLPPSWHVSAYQAYMKTNHVIDLDNNPGQVYQIGSVLAEEYTCKLAPVHPYFFHRTNIPPLIKTSKINPPPIAK